MALQTYLVGVASASTIANLGTLDDCVVGAQASLLSGSTAILGTGSNQSVAILGAVYGQSAGIHLYGTGSAGDAVTVGATGSVTSDGTAIWIASNGAWVQNSGSVSALSWGIYLDADAPTLCKITNAGLIVASTGIGTFGTATTNILNTGRIEATNGAFYGSDESSANIRNLGTMVGDLSFGNQNDVLINRGSIDGTVRMDGGDDKVTIRGLFDGIINLGTGDDQYDAVRATASEIRVLGDEGDDVFLPGAAIEILEGGAGVDSVNYYRAGAGIAISLAGTLNSGGAAKGDSFYLIEDAYGTTYDDRIIGSQDDNFLFGNMGNDTLVGGAGTDRLAGGDGVDRLAGGDGNDTFLIYGTPDEGVDLILDFSNAIGDNDDISILANGTFAGLSAGALLQSQFRSRNDNLAQDADDRFIFNKLDNSLWYDSNGNLDGGLTQVLVLQNGTNIGFADIMIV